MPNFELHADYDKDGVVSLSASEYGQRRHPSGAILIPNLDIENRRLTARPVSGPLPRLDFENNRRVRVDDDRYLLVIKVIQIPAGVSQVYLRCSAFVASRIEIFTDRGQALSRRPGFNDHFRLPAFNRIGQYPFKIIVKNIPGGVFDRHNSLSRRYIANRSDESRFELCIISYSTAGRATIYDDGRFSIAPFLLMDTILPVRKLYISTLPENTATVQEVRGLTSQWRVPLIEVANRQTHDVWHQDQYQHSFIQGAQQNLQELILHLPRMRNNTFSFSSRQPNLASFVNHYFPSDDVGIYTDLWRRQFAVNARNGQSYFVRFTDTNLLNDHLELVTSLYTKINEYGYAADINWHTINFFSWYERRAHLSTSIQTLRNTINRTASRRGSHLSRSRATTMMNYINRKHREINRYSRFSAPAGLSVLIDGQWAPIDRNTVEDLFKKIDAIHSSSNYGGNIESSPPVAGAQLGKIILGNKTNQAGEEFVDRDILKVFAFQRKQPIVEIDTTWLDVGHVDEVISVIPIRPGDSQFCFFNASPRVAMTLCQKAIDKYIAGLPPNHVLRTRPQRFYRTTLDSRIMSSGTSPVTRLFRGHAWLQGENMDVPQAYSNIARQYQGITSRNPFPQNNNASNLGINPEPGERKYPSDLSVLDLLTAEKDDLNQSCNRFIDSNFVQSVRTKIGREFSGKRIFEIPVLFDRIQSVSQWRANPEDFKATALSPDMANLQYVNGKLLIPRPYGPRMNFQDAIEIVQETLRDHAMREVMPRVSRALIARHRLDRGVYWVEKYDPVEWVENGVTYRFGGLRNRNDVIELFKDSFPGATARELERQIILPNAGNFNRAGVLRRPISQFRITDQMADLFELITVAISETAQVEPHFVDTWFYHVRYGQVHCGTNALRETRSAARLPKFWRVPDARLR
jgi:hypothetical protein